MQNIKQNKDEGVQKSTNGKQNRQVALSAGKYSCPKGIH